MSALHNGAGKAKADMLLLLLVSREFLPIERNVVACFIPIHLNVRTVTVLALADVALPGSLAIKQKVSGFDFGQDSTLSRSFCLRAVIFMFGCYIHKVICR
jgi:hypothetical protein